MILSRGFNKPVLLLHPLGGWTKADDVPLKVYGGGMIFWNPLPNLCLLKHTSLLGICLLPGMWLVHEQKESV